MQQLNILGVEITPGSSHQLYLNIAKLHTRNNVDMPVIIERAEEDGPVILLNAGVHGDELNGIEIVRRIIAEGHHKPKRGTIICIPVLNVFGFLNLSRKFPDGRDLNRMFPGSKTGSLASQFAYKFKTEIAPHVDYMLDFHTGGADRSNAAQIRCALSDTKAIELAKIFNAPYLVYSKTIPKSMRDMMHKLGKTIILFEGGKSLCFEEDIIQEGVNGALRVLSHFEMTDVQILPNDTTIEVMKSSWLRASHSGMFMLNVDHGSKVKKNQLLGTIVGPYGEFSKKVLAPFGCSIFCVNTAPIVNKGDALFHVSKSADNQEI